MSNGGSEATVRNHRQGASEASGIEPRSEGAKRPCAIIGQERAERCAISEVRERSDRSRANEVSVGKHTSSDGGSEATVCRHRQGASGASVIEPQIENKQVVISVRSAELKAERGPLGRAQLKSLSRRRTHKGRSVRAGWYLQTEQTCGLMPRM